uniref:Uncharacterized protein n=1 Tax=Anopheles minimus TaxID=112268 RepID=A0A182WND0_9DIPT
MGHTEAEKKRMFYNFYLVPFRAKYQSSLVWTSSIKNR